MTENPIITRVFDRVQQIPAAAWDGLLAAQAQPTPFLRHGYLAALESSASAVPDTGWQPAFITLWQGDALVAACPLYLKSHSYGEYVFDWAWARAYAEHGLAYYPKAVAAVPFTPVPGTRLLVAHPALRAPLLAAVQGWCEQRQLSSAHLLFVDAEDQAACTEAGWMLRHNVQFHWQNMAPTLPAAQDALPPEEAPPTLDVYGDALSAPARGFADFEAFLTTLQQAKRKKIRQERRRVAEAGVSFQALAGAAITEADWDFFYACYARTYAEHGNPPYLSRAFFSALAASQGGHWVLFVAQREGRPIACSLIALSADVSMLSDIKTSETKDGSAPAAPVLQAVTAYGRYWGALERVDCLHFEACYYQPLQWCIEHGIAAFEGGAQGEHKMARALLPVPTASAHWVAHPAFAEAIADFLQREDAGMDAYLEHLQTRLPLRQAGG